MPGIRLQRPWTALEHEAVRRSPAVLGVYELADADGNVGLIGYAGGRSPFGLRSEVAAHVGSFDRFRYEITSAHLSRWQELLMVHQVDHGTLAAYQPRPRPPPRSAQPPVAGEALMDLQPTDEQQLIVQTVRRFVREEIIPLEADLDPDADASAPDDHKRLLASEAGGRVVDRAIQIHGGNGGHQGSSPRTLVPRDAHTAHRRGAVRGATDDRGP